MSVIVFDIGNVLVHWDPHLAYLDTLGSREEVQAFFDRIDFARLNLEGDRGARFADLAAGIDDPADRALFQDYPARYRRTIAEPIAGSWALLDRLAARGHEIHAITNWSAETWPVGVAVHPRLGEVFGVTVVSGQERMVKPDPAIFECLLGRAGVQAADCLFVDDSARNAEAARAVGMAAHHFSGPAALERDLTERGLL